MSSIWAFLTQTLTASCVAALLLAVKWLMADKLSPRWQYGVWSLLALRIILPVDVNGYILLPVSVWVEQLKTLTERGLTSAYAEVYTPVEIRHILPFVSEMPVSLTDWLFIIYIAGVAVCILRYTLSYIRLRLLLKRGEQEDGAVLASVCQKYRLKPCRVVSAEGLETAFVCGVIRPVLVIPAQGAPDEKILLHELLHRKYQDPLQSILWTAARCLHWCNPFLVYVFNRIENDMESLCDQRVLELLEGEERREYGNILLDMASSRYARAPGTSSISNGAKNISHRIAAIVRFKKYPRGMALVSVCILLMLLPPVLQGSAYEASSGGYHSSRLEWEMALARTRIRRCTTAAGAIDTYAKGLLLKDVEYIATSAPVERQQELVRQGEDYGCYQPGSEFADVYIGDGYRIYGLHQTEEGYLCWLAYTTMTEDAQKATLMVSLRVFQEQGFWVAQETGQRLALDVERGRQLERTDGPWAVTLYGQGETGSITIRRISIHEVGNTQESGDFFGWVSTFDTDMKPDAEFLSVSFTDMALYECSQRGAPQKKVGIRFEPMSSSRDAIVLPQTQTGTGGGGSSDGSFHQNLVLEENWDGTLTAENNLWTYGQEEPIPECFKAGIYFDGQLVEELIITEVEE